MDDIDLPQNWKNKQCKDCIFLIDFPGSAQMSPLGQPKMKECRKNPPIPVAVLGQAKGGVQTQIMVMYPRFPEVYPACSNFKHDFLKNQENIK